MYLEYTTYMYSCIHIYMYTSARQLLIRNCFAGQAPIYLRSSVSRYHLCRAAGLSVLLSRVIWSYPGLGWLRPSAGASLLLVHLFGMICLAASVLNSLLCICLSSAAV